MTGHPRQPDRQSSHQQRCCGKICRTPATRPLRSPISGPSRLGPLKGCHDANLELLLLHRLDDIGLDTELEKARAVPQVAGLPCKYIGPNTPRIREISVDTAGVSGWS